jgi:hypothetical protein
MDLKAGIDFTNRWLDLSHELHSQAGTWTDSLADRVKGELAGSFLTAETWDGDAPFTPFEDRLLPAPGAALGDALAKRAFFKGEQWSAPDVGGIVRAFLSDDQVGWTDKPKIVLDIADVQDAPRIVAMHTPCPRCKTTTIGKTGDTCDYVTRSGQPCLDGLIFAGGLAFDRGAHQASERLAAPDPKWAAMMER